ncbi:MAG: hypothetical protein QG656_1931, partial [Candidatus Hydrogenedentes bacterium]|nr:hypothetical protein [Candidatus Hydrogenedentota bacterium]
MADSEIVGRLLGMAVLDRMPAENKAHVAQLFVDVSETKDIADGEALIHEGYLAFESGYVLVDGVVSIDREDMK